MNAIETENLTKEFDAVTAVADLDLSVERGDVYGFLGPNGAGKSTTISMLLDYVRPTSGTASVLGLDAQRDSVAVRRRVGVLPEGCELYHRLTGRTHVAFAVDASDASDDPDDLLERVGAYSTGMTQRLRLALALVGDPDLLILDEPSSGMDPNGVRLLRDLVATERDRGTTIFFSSHVLEQVEAVCDRVGVLVDGRLAVSGEVDELLAAVGHAVRLSIAVAEVAPGIEESLAALDAVADVRVTDGGTQGRTDGVRVEVSLEDEAAKAAVLRRVEEHARIEDFSLERRSLEALFRRYAAGGR